MKIGAWVGLLAAAAVLNGCGDFWQAPSNSTTSFTLSNSGNISVDQGSSGTVTVTVTPGSSFTGSVALTCAVTTQPTSPTSPATCSMGTTSLSFTSASSQTSTLTVDTTSTTTVGAYDFTITGVSGTVAATTSVCVAVGTSTSSCSSATGTSGDFYILNGTSIAGYSISSGVLTAITNGSATLPGSGTTPYSLAIAPNGKFLAVGTSTGVYAYPITSGALGTPVQVTQDQAYNVQIDMTSSWLVEAYPVASVGEVTLSATPVNSLTGANTGGTAYSQPIPIANAAVQKNKMVISQDNAHVFVALGAGGTLVVPFSSSSPFPSSVLTSSVTIPVLNTLGSAVSVAVDPGTTPRLFYIGEILGNTAGTSGGLRAFTYASLATPSALVQASGSPIASGGLSPFFILPEAAGGYVYVADGAGTSTSGVVAGFTITGTTPYTIAADATADVGIQPLGLAEDSKDSYILEVGSNSPYFDAFSFSSSTGALTSEVTSTTASSNLAIVAAP